jgi:DNA polymerase-3 subunit alpha
MGKKRPEQMEAKRLAFTEGCKHRKIPPAKAERIFATMEKFAGYGFNKSHSAAYALLAYQCAWLKAHHPAEFMAATLTSEMSDSSRIVTLIEEARRMQIGIRPPDVNRSSWKFTLEEAQIRFGLGAVRNVGQGVVESLIAARGGEADGVAATPFRDLHDLARRLGGRALNRRVLESLIAAGACDELGPARAAMFAAAGRTLESAASLQRERESGQSSLFGDGGDAGGGGGAVALVSPPMPDVPPWTGRERSAREKEVLGFYFSEHPLEHVREELERIATHSIADVLQMEDGVDARLAGIVLETKSITTRGGKLMAVVTLEDLSGRIECTVFPELWESARSVLAADQIAVVTGRVEARDERAIKMLLSDAVEFEEARRRYRASLQLKIGVEELTVERLETIDQVLSAHPGEAEVYVYIVNRDRSIQAMRSRRYHVAEGPAVVESLKERCAWLAARWAKGAS